MMEKFDPIDDLSLTWSEVFHTHDEDPTLAAYANPQTGELEIVLVNDEGECIRRALSSVDSAVLVRALGRVITADPVG